MRFQLADGMVRKLTENEDDTGASEAVAMLFHIMGGLGLFFTGIGVLWFVTVYKDKKE